MKCHSLNSASRWYVICWSWYLLDKFIPGNVEFNTFWSPARFFNKRFHVEPQSFNSLGVNITRHKSNAVVDFVMGVIIHRPQSIVRLPTICINNGSWEYVLLNQGDENSTCSGLPLQIDENAFFTVALDHPQHPVLLVAGDATAVVLPSGAHISLIDFHDNPCKKSGLAQKYLYTWLDNKSST